MRPRTEALLALGALAGLVILAGALGQRDRGGRSVVPRASTYFPSPLGARALADGLTRLGVDVRRQRRSFRQLASDTVPEAGTALVLLDPTFPPAGSEVIHLLNWSEGPAGGDLVLAGPGAEAVMRCFGYALDWRGRDSLALGAGGWPLVAGVLAARRDTVVTDSSRLADARISRCVVPPVARVDTLLTTTSGRVAALRLTRQDTGRDVLLFSDAGLFRNQALRQGAAGPWMLGLFAGSWRRVIFEESHQGFGAGGSLLEALLAWSRRSPWGWALWQLGLVGLLALGAGAVRFGPLRRVLDRRRRSPLEHVRALATALAAAKGHDVAIGLMIEGLRRRLLPAGQRPRGDREAWLAQLAENVRTPRARAAVRRLQTLNRPGRDAEAVRQAADAVEDVWQELHP